MNGGLTGMNGLGGDGAGGAQMGGRGIPGGGRGGQAVLAVEVRPRWRNPRRWLCGRFGGRGGGGPVVADAAVAQADQALDAAAPWVAPAWRHSATAVGTGACSTTAMLPSPWITPHSTRAVTPSTDRIRPSRLYAKGRGSFMLGGPLKIPKPAHPDRGARSPSTISCRACATASPNTQTMPTLLERTGDFSQSIGAQGPVTILRSADGKSVSGN